MTTPQQHQETKPLTPGEIAAERYIYKIAVQWLIQRSTFTSADLETLLFDYGQSQITIEHQKEKIRELEAKLAVASASLNTNNGNGKH